MNAIKERNIGVCILLTLVTCGIYGIFWFISLTDDMRVASGDDSLSGGKAYLFTLITCGIYGYFWAYQMGKASNVAKAKYGLATTDNSILYIVFQVIGLGIINYCLLQNDLNEISIRKY